jgi:putative ABC transport system permease protein
VLAFALAASCATSVVFGLVPACNASRRGNLQGTLKEGARGGPAAGQAWLRHGLVIAEVALSVVLLTGAGLLGRSFFALASQDLGYSADRVLAVQLEIPDERYPDGPAARALLQRLRGEVLALPGVAAAAFSSGVPLDDGWGRIVTVEGRELPLAEMPAVNHVVVTADYFKTLGIPLLRGRPLTAADFDAPRVAVVSAAFAARHFPRGAALGRRIRFGPPRNQEPWHTIVGIVADSRHGQIKGEDRPNVYVPASRTYTPGSLLVRAAGGGDPLRLAAALRSRLAAVDRDIVIGSAQTLDDIASRSAWRDRFSAVLFAVFAGLALLLAAAGLYAVLSYTVSLRAGEIGIRMALGATLWRVRALVLRQGLGLATVGLAIGLAAAAGLARLIAAQLYGVTPADALTWGGVPLLFLLVAGLAALIPSGRAARLDPAAALRRE